MKFYGKELEEIRLSKECSIQELADAVGVNRASIWAWESGKRKPRDKFVIAIAKKLNICVSEISDMEPVKKILPVDYSSSAEVLLNLKGNTQSQIIKKLQDSIGALDNEFSKTNIILNSLIKAIDTAFYFKDANGKYIIANKAYLKLLGVNDNYSILGKSDKDLFSLKEAESNRKQDYDVLMSGKSLKNIEGYIPGTRKKRWGLFSRIPLTEQDEYVSGLIVTITDITDRKKEEQRRLLLESALDNIDVGVWVSQMSGIGNKSCNIKYLNRIFEDWSGYSREYAYSNQDFWKEFLNRREIIRHKKSVYQKPGRLQVRNVDIKTKTGEVLSTKEKVFNFENMRIGIIRNHTQEKELMKTNDILRNLVDIDGKIAWYSYVGRSKHVSKLDFVNDYVYPIAGIEPGSMKNNYRLWKSIVYIDDRRKYYSWFNSDVFPKEMSYRIVQQKTRKIVWVKEKIYQINNIRYGIIENITNEKIKEQELERINHYKDILFDNIDIPSSGYWIQEISPDNKLLYISKGYQKILGVDRKRLYKEPQLWKTCVHPDNLKDLESHKIPECNERISVKYLIKNKRTMIETKVENQIVLINKADRLVLGGFINTIK